jgi:predicted nucleotidyltransferase
MLYVRPDRPIEPLTLQVLEAVAPVAAALGLPWFVAGATARDILLTGVFGLKTGLATRDVDLAVAVAGWQHFDELKRELLRTDLFHDIRNVAHRLYYRPTGTIGGYPLDLIPFGGVEGEDNSIAWPPDMNEIMSVAGYKEAHAAAVEVAITRDLVVRVASLPGLAILKVFAWKDRGDGDSKDAIDLVTLLRGYADGGNTDRLYGAELDVLAAVDYDVELASARLLGCDVRAISTAPTIEQLEGILTSRADRLISHMARGSRAADDAVNASEHLLTQFLAGLRGDLA